MTTQTTTAKREPEGHYEMRLGERWVSLKEGAIRAIASQSIGRSGYDTPREMIMRFIKAHPDDYRYVEKEPAPEREEIKL